MLSIKKAKYKGETLAEIKIVWNDRSYGLVKLTMPKPEVDLALLYLKDGVWLSSIVRNDATLDLDQADVGEVPD